MHTVHQLVQGSPEWSAHRRSHFNASEAAAMLGLSPYQTRTELLQQKSTGLAPEVDAQKQALFDHGHANEAAARPMAEAIIGEDLYPITASRVVDDLPLSASYDGTTMGEEITWECKSLNRNLAECLPRGEIPEQYKPQMEQQLLVLGAERCLFMASDGVSELHAWYQSDPAVRAQVLAGWKQFAVDLANYVPVEVLPAVVAAPQPSLPAVVVRMDGALTVDSNLPDFALALREYIANIPAKPSTDQEFADAEAACKALKTAEAALESAENNALAQMTDVEQMRRIVGDLRALSRTTRLATEKLVTARKEQIRTEIYQEGITAYRKHVEGLNTRLGKSYMPPLPVDFAGCIKGKKTVSSLRDAVSGHLATAKIAANDVADRIQINLATLVELASDYRALFPDTAAIVLKAPDDLTALVKTRIAEHLEAEAERARKVEEAKEAARKAAAEKAEAEEQALRARVDAERVAREQAATHVAQTPATAPEPATVMTTTPTSAPGAALPRQFDQGDRSPPVPARTRRPNDVEIIDVLSLHYRVHESKVLEWLLDMDLAAAGQRITEAV